MKKVNNGIEYVERFGVPDYIPSEQVSKYRAMRRQRKCEEGKIKKRKEYEKIRRKRNEGKDNY